jgi:hypothetical protein
MSDYIEQPKLCEEQEKNPYAAAVHRSLEQRARGISALEAGQFQAHFLAAELLQPKPPK